MTSYRLIYFNLRAKAAVIRMIFAAADQKYEDHRIEWPNEQWSELKTQFPFKQLPVLEVTENSKTYTIAQSMTISRFLANRFGLAGKNELERTYADMIIDQVTDIFNGVRLIHRQPDSDSKQAALETAYNETYPRMLLDIQCILERNQSGYLVGESVTYADFYLVNLYDWFCGSKEDILSKLPLLKEHDQRIRNMERLRDFLKREGVNTKLSILLK